MSRLTKEQQRLYEQLTRLQQETANAKLTGLSDAEAYKTGCEKIGKKPSKAAKQCGQQILSHTAVAAFLESIQKPIAIQSVNNAIMTREEMLERLSVIARGTVADVAEFSKRHVGDAIDGTPVYQTVWELRDSDKLTGDQAALISELAATRDGFKFKMHSPLAAIKQLSDMQGFNAPTKTEVSGPGGESVRVEFVKSDVDKTS